MNEQDWLECTDPTPMLQLLRDTASDRRLRLFACACCRSIWRLFKEKGVVKKTLEFAEKYADGLATKNELNGCAWGKPGEFSGVVMRKAWDAAEYCTDHASGKVECESRLQDPVLDELHRFDTHMRDARGLAKNTRAQRLHILRS